MLTVGIAPLSPGSVLQLCGRRRVTGEVSMAWVEFSNIALLEEWRKSLFELRGWDSAAVLTGGVVGVSLSS